MQVKTVSVIGLGKLGLPLALLFSAHEYSVIGYDIFTPTIDKLKRGKSPIVEPHVQKLLNKTKIQFSSNAHEVIAKTDITFIVVPTPSKKDGSFSSLHIEEALKNLSPYLKQKKSRHTIIITSTISPGTIESRLKPLLERLTKKLVGTNIGLCYSPELIALGSVIENIQNPDFLFIGESDTKTGQVVEKIRKSICLNNPQVIHTNWINAELIKLSLNAYITTKISYSNMIARICERIEGADSEIVLGTIGRDSRIGVKYLKGGIGYGGPCFPRDTISLSSTIKEVGLDIQLPKAIYQFNREQINALFAIVKSYCGKKTTVGVLGLGYKPNTNVVEESQGVLLIQKLIKHKIKVNAFDPIASDNAKKQAPSAHYITSLDKCIQMSDVLVLTTPWEEFKRINWSGFTDKIIIDCWRIIDLNKQDKGRNTFVQLGRYISQP